MLDVAEIYRDRFARTGLERRDRVWKVLCKSFFDQRVPRNATVLELACGYGEFINNIAAGQKLAVDINPDAARHLEPDVRFFNISATDSRHGRKPDRGRCVRLELPRTPGG